ncbi:EthD family reductase [Henriciella mobilis]|uniref:EthD family reductase n=1 Tax=Henriciella mobilis TaxID=2305467 RepID=A0A399RS45_9PROT|nr:EthD family reductase [Henriciella mobilis]RIJ32717.1 EthD family reductase [Henriciella mobilis]
MKKMIALYKAPGDADAFMKHYETTHMPLVEKIPGLVKTELTRIDRTLIGEQGNFLIAEMYFEDEASFKAALKSPENAATGADLANFAEGIVTVMIGETL